MPRALVVIPTFDHADMVTRAIASVRGQTVQDFELFVIGDGAPERTGELLAEVCAEDPRVQYVRHPKGEGNGESYRHQVLKASGCEVVCYLGDDDLWLPRHLETMLLLLQNADFAHTLHVEMRPEGYVCAWGADLTCASFRARMLNSNSNFFGPTCAGHTLAAYRRLFHGWRPRPDGIASDLYMWRQWLTQDWCRFHSEPTATSLHFPTPQRTGWTLAQRLQELDHWSRRLAEPGFDAWLQRTILIDWQRRVIPPWTMTDIAALHRRAGGLAEAEWWCARALELLGATGHAPDRLPVVFERAKILTDQGRGAEAVSLLEQVVVDDWDEAALIHLAQMRFKMGEAKGAEEALASALKIDPGNPAYHHLMAQILAAQQRAEEAAVLARRAVELDPENPHCQAHLGALLLNQNRPDEAGSALQRALQLAPDLADVHFQLSRLHLALNEHEDAVRTARRALELQPHNTQWREHLARLEGQATPKTEPAVGTNDWPQHTSKQRLGRSWRTCPGLTSMAFHRFAQRRSALFRFLFMLYCRCGRSPRPPQVLNFVGGKDFDRLGRAHFRNICAIAGATPEDRVLDVGCGMGRVALHFASYLSERGRYAGFDIVQLGVDWCSARIARKHPHFKFTHADVYNKEYNPRGSLDAATFRFPYDDQQFSLVFATSVLTHMLPDAALNYLHEIARVLEPGGRSVVTFFVIDEMSRRSMTAGNLNFQQTDSGYWTTVPDNPEAAIAFEEKQILSMYERAGLEVHLPLHYGDWSGRDGAVGGQDCVLASKR